MVFENGARELLARTPVEDEILAHDRADDAHLLLVDVRDHRCDVVAAAFQQELLHRGDVRAVFGVARAVAVFAHQRVEGRLADHHVGGRIAVEVGDLVAQTSSDAVHDDVFAGCRRGVDVGFDELEAQRAAICTSKTDWQG